MRSEGWLAGRASWRRARGVVVATALAIAGVGSYAPAAAAPAKPVPSQPWRAEQWYLDAVGAADAWQVTKGSGVTVAVIDSGVLTGHPVLRDRVLPGFDWNTEVYWEPDDPGTKDGQGHGTAIASLIAGNGSDGFYGVAPEATILPMKISVSFFGAGGSPPDPKAAARGVVRAVDYGVEVVNLAFSHPEHDYVRLREAIAYAQEHDVVVVAAAGNKNEARVGNPAAFPGVISVGAVDRDRTRTGESSYGSKLAVVAPGEELLMAAIQNEGPLGQGAAGGFGKSHGTSYATGFVSGTVALVRARHPEMSAEDVVNRVVRTATDLGPQGRDPEYGFGLVNAASAVTGEVSDVRTNPLGSLAPPPPEEDDPGVQRLLTAGRAVAAGSGLVAAAGLVLVGLGVAGLVQSRRGRRSPAPPPPPGAPPFPPHR